MEELNSVFICVDDAVISAGLKHMYSSQSLQMKKNDIISTCLHFLLFGCFYNSQSVFFFLVWKEHERLKVSSVTFM